MDRVPEYNATYNRGTMGKSHVDAKIRLDERNLTIKPMGGDLIQTPYFRILGINSGNYRVSLQLESENIEISQLGYEYENFLKNLYKLRGELLLKYTLMNESFVGKGIEAHYSYSDGVNPRLEGECELRVYESALVALPERADPIRIPLCFVGSVRREDYLIRVFVEGGEELAVSQMGERTDYFLRSLSKALSDVEVRARELLGGLSSNVDPDELKRAASLMRDGVAAASGEITEISPQLWIGLEESIRRANLGDEYGYLKGISRPGKVSVGVKRGLMGDKTGQYVWFLAPIYDPDPSKVGNALVLEAASDDASSRATYVFRMMDSMKYRSGLSLAELDSAADRAKRLVNRCLIDVNFRREPIYLGDDLLRGADYERYFYAVNKMPSLRLLRESFMGRVFHTSLDKWREELNSLIREKM